MHTMHASDALVYGSTKRRQSGDTACGAMMDACLGFVHWTMYACVAQVFLGAAFACISATFLYGMTQAIGLLIGGVLAAAGVLGLIGSYKRATSWLAAHLVIVLLAAMMALQFCGEVSRDMEVDCSIAELEGRMLHTAQLVQRQQQQELFNSVYNRLNEMEDMLEMVHTGTVSMVQLKQTAGELRMRDADYIAAKLRLLKKHAQVLLDATLDALNMKRVPGKKDEYTISVEEQQILERRIDAAQKVFDRIEAHHSGDEDAITTAEYVDLLEGLNSAFARPAGDDFPPLQAESDAHKDMDALDEALKRMSDNAYHHHAAEYHADDAQYLNQAARYRKDSRREFATTFNELLKHHGDSAYAAAVDSLASMPEHCYMESRARGVLIGSTLTVLITQLASAFFAISALLRMPVKSD